MRKRRGLFTRSRLWRAIDVPLSDRVRGEAGDANRHSANRPQILRYGRKAMSTAGSILGHSFPNRIKLMVPWLTQYQAPISTLV